MKIRNGYLKLRLQIERDLSAYRVNVDNLSGVTENG